MQHDHVLKKWKFDLSTTSPWLGGGGVVGFCMQNIGSVPNRDSLKFDMQHDYVLKKWKFDLLTHPEGRGGGLWAKYLPPCWCINDSL